MHDIHDVHVPDCTFTQGIPPDDIFDDFDDADLDIGSSNAIKLNARGDDDDSMVQSRKRRRMQSNEGTPAPSDLFDDGSSFQSGIRESVDREMANQITSLPRKVMEFNEKLVQVLQSPLQPSSTPDHLQHRFMVKVHLHVVVTSTSLPRPIFFNRPGVPLEKNGLGMRLLQVHTSCYASLGAHAHMRKRGIR